MSANLDDVEDSRDVALREVLGVRPVIYADEDSPDPNSCPTWCGLNEDGYGHEVDWCNPMRATHTLETWPFIVGSLYSGSHNSGTAMHDAYVHTASIEAHLEQVSTREPMVRVYLRHWPERKQVFVERLRLRIEDARELATMLTYVADVADGRRRAGC